MINVNNLKYVSTNFDVDFYQYKEVCIGVLGIQATFHFTSRDMGYYVQFQGYCFFLLNIQIQSRNINNINTDHFKLSTKEDKLSFLKEGLPS